MQRSARSVSTQPVSIHLSWFGLHLGDRPRPGLSECQDVAVPENDSSILPKRAVEAWKLPRQTTETQKQQRQNSSKRHHAAGAAIAQPIAATGNSAGSGTRSSGLGTHKLRSPQAQDRKIHMPLDTALGECLLLSGSTTSTDTALRRRKCTSRASNPTRLQGTQLPVVLHGTQTNAPKASSKELKVQCRLVRSNACRTCTCAYLHLVSKKVIDSGNSLGIYFNAASQGTCPCTSAVRCCLICRLRRRMKASSRCSSQCSTGASFQPGTRKVQEV